MSLELISDSLWDYTNVQQHFLWRQKNFRAVEDISHIWLLNTGNLASTTKKLKFNFTSFYTDTYG